MFTVTEGNPAFPSHRYTSHPMSSDELPTWVDFITGDGGTVLSITRVDS